MVTSRQHLSEINHAPVHQLSLHAVAKEFLQPKYTMHGFEWKDIRGVEGTGFVRALRHTLTNHLPNLMGCLRLLIADEVSKGVKKSPATTSEPCQIRGEKVQSKADNFSWATPSIALSPSESLSGAGELFGLLRPGALLVARCATKNHRASLTFYKHLEGEVTRRIKNSNDDAYQGSSKQNDGLQWLIDTAPKRAAWSIDRIVGEVMGIWYGSVHTLGIGVTYALHDIYSHPECMDPVIRELKTTNLDAFSGAPHELPVLDTGIRRKALEPFTFSDGLSVARGEWVCVPHRSMMRDSRFFPDALEFQPFRFYQPPKEGGQVFPDRGSFLTDASDSWLVWGAGRILCPGRFYATAVQKLVVAQMLLGYDCELAPLPGPRSMQWRSTIIPKPSVGLLVKEKRARPDLHVE
ncbi:cytochrome P450 [Apiospora kogelbergensis]